MKILCCLVLKKAQPKGKRSRNHLVQYCFIAKRKGLCGSNRLKRHGGPNLGHQKSSMFAKIFNQEANISHRIHGQLWCPLRQGFFHYDKKDSVVCWNQICDQLTMILVTVIPWHKVEDVHRSLINDPTDKSSKTSFDLSSHNLDLSRI